MSKKIVRYLSMLLAVSVLFSGISLQITTAYADTADDAAPNTEAVVSTTSELKDYVEYSSSHGISNKATADVEVPIGAYAADGADVTVNENGINWASGEGSVTWTFEVNETALYNLKFVWEPKESGVDITFGVMIDGKYLFAGSDEIVLSRIWKNATDEPRKDAQGNEYAQEQAEHEGAIETVVRDTETAIIDPFEFALTAGVHTITIVEPEQNIDIQQIVFKSPENIESYEKVSASYDVKDLDADIITLEGEKADLKTSNSIIPKSNTSDAGMTPSGSYITKINYIGGTSWQVSGDRIEWKFDVEKSGYYYINMRYKQSDLVNGDSWRWLKIDGKTPFEEAKSLIFPYGTSWEYYTFAGGEENPYYIYLD